MPVWNENHLFHRQSKNYKEDPQLSELMGQRVSFTPMGNTWEEESARDPPRPPEIPDEIVYVPIEDTAWDQHENPGFAG